MRAHCCGPCIDTLDVVPAWPSVTPPSPRCARTSIVHRPLSTRCRLPGNRHRVTTRCRWLWKWEGGGDDLRHIKGWAGEGGEGDDLWHIEGWAGEGGEGDGLRHIEGWAGEGGGVQVETAEQCDAKKNANK